jgi:hypothetical protein
MGLTLLDFQFQVEKAFKIRMPKGWPQRLGIVTVEADATLEQFHQLVLELCREQRVMVPPNSWTLVAECVTRATCIEGPLPSMTIREIDRH